MSANYPPGCTADDIDRAAGQYKTECEDCHESFFANELDEDGRCPECAEKLSPCCGKKFDPDTRVCPRCKEIV